MFKPGGSSQAGEERRKSIDTSGKSTAQNRNWHHDYIDIVDLVMMGLGRW